MSAITARLLHLRPILRPILRPHPYTLHHFSSSSPPDSPDRQPQTEPEPEPEFTSQRQTPSPLSSYLTDLKASLQREPSTQNRPPRPQPFSSPTPPPQTPTSRVNSLDEIRRNLSEYRRRAAPPPPSSGQFVSLQELYKRNLNSNSGNPATVKSPSMGALPERIRQMRPGEGANQIGFGPKSVDPMALARFKESLNQTADPNAHMGSKTFIGGTDSNSFPWKKKGSENDGTDSAAAKRTALVRSYEKPELGKKLQMLRPGKTKGNWFSFQELNERLARLREVEEKEESIGGFNFRHLRQSLVNLKDTKDEDKRQKTLQRLDVLSNLGGTPSFMLSPPKEHLVEQYFHPDCMSSAEKLKLELKKVRDEFKMSESDCGSARVQVAQLTTKIKHLSTVLAKKDKHSRKGLLAMVQRRKKLLKYLRRTDWDSYSLVLSKLGLRDNPDIKIKA